MKVSKAFIISLPLSARRQNIEKQVREWQLPFPVEVFDAISKNNVTDQIITLETGEQFIVDQSRILAIEKRLLSSGEIGCMLSHYSIWKKIADDDTIQAALILEDDFTFQLEAKEMIALFDLLPNDFDICYYQQGVQYIIKSKISDFYFDTYPSICTYGYVISKTFAKRLVDTFKLNRQSDDYIAEYIMNIEPTTKIISCYYPFVGVLETMSEIGERYKFV